MTEELEVRFLVESVEGTYCVSGYATHDGSIHFTEGDGVIHSIPLKDIIKVTKESVSREDVTSSLKTVALV